MGIRNLKASLLIWLKKADAATLRTLDRARLPKQGISKPTEVTASALLRSAAEYDHALFRYRQKSNKPIGYRVYIVISRGAFRLARKTVKALRKIL